MADATLFFSLIFAYFYLWTVAPAWPPQDMQPTALLWPTLGLILLVLSSLAIEWAQSGIRQGKAGQLRAGLIAALILALAYLAVEAIALLNSGISAKTHAYGALIYTIAGFAFIHVGIAVLMAASTLVAAWRGRVAQHSPATAEVTRLFWHYTVLQWLTGFGVVHVFPHLAS